MRTNLSYFFTVLAFGLGAAMAHSVSTTRSTVPEGLLSLDFVATAAQQNLTTYVSLPLVADPVYTGAVSMVTANTLSVADAKAPFVNGAVGVQLANLATAHEPFFVRFLSGAQAGRTILVKGNTASTLTLDTSDNSTLTTDLDAPNFTVAPNDTFEVFPGTTLGSLFGENTTRNPLLLHGDVSKLLADTVSIYNAGTSRFQSYFFDTTPAVNAWVLAGTTAAINDTPVFPGSALAIVRRGGEAALSIVPMARVTKIATVGALAAETLVPMSRVQEVAGKIKTPGNGQVVYGSTLFPVNMTLAQLQLGSNWTRDDSKFSADTISIYNAASSRFDSYYQRATDSTWRSTTDATTDQSTLVTIPAGSVIAILHRAPVNNDSSSFLSSGMPYSLK